MLCKSIGEGECKCVALKKINVMFKSRGLVNCLIVDCFFDSKHLAERTNFSSCELDTNIYHIVSLLTYINSYQTVALLRPTTVMPNSITDQ